MRRREFLEALAAGIAAALPLSVRGAEPDAESFYALGRRRGNVTLLHLTDSHAQLLPVYFREPDVNIGVGSAHNEPPHLVGEAFLERFGVARGTPLAYACTHLDFSEAARRYGRLGGFAHLATLVEMARASRPGALLLDGGDNWQGSATALWTQGRDMIAASRRLGVDVMTGHWEFTYGADRLRHAIANELGPIEFLAQNVRTVDFDDAVFRSYVLREINGAPVAIVGQAFPYTPIANPRHFVPDWTFGIQEERLQNTVNEARAKGAWAVILLSHNGVDVDLKLASRVTGIDAILGGHTHDALPQPVSVRNSSGTTLVTSAGCNGKFLAVLDLDVTRGGVRGYEYRLLPVFSNVLPAHRDMAAIIRSHRAPYESKLAEKLATTEGLLYRRGNFNGTLDQVILDALMQAKDAEIGFSPGFRWGTSILPGSAITMEDVMNATAITYPYVTVAELTGETIKALLEDICDNLFNPDPYYQQGGDMVRVGGLQYSCSPTAAMGRRISDLRVRGAPLQASKRYKVVSWAPVGEGASGEAVWDVVAAYLRDRKVIEAPRLNRPALIGVEGNRGVARHL